MSTLIVICAQKKVDGRWENSEIAVFEGRANDFDLFAFFGHRPERGVIPPIVSLRGVPDDYADAAIFAEACDDCSYVTTAELMAFDYEQTFEERRTWFEMSPGSFSRGPTLEPGQGFRKSIRNLLGLSYFADLQRLEREGIERIIIGFA